MNAFLELKAATEHESLAKLRNRPFAFLGVLSFEDRCVAVANILKREGLSPTQACVTSYQTRAVPEDLDSVLRARNFGLFALDLSCEGCRQSCPLSPYSWNALREQMLGLLFKWKDLDLLIDITCMTRIHLFVLSSLIANGELPHERVTFVYTSPQSYNVDGNDSLGWRDTILVPIGKNRVFRREGHARGIVLAGHDSERIGVALCELEPASGVLLFANTPRRPDFLQRSREVIRPISKRLLTLRMPRQKENVIQGMYDSWLEGVVDIADFEELSRHLLPQIEDARKDKGPIILFPFGPKSLSMACGIVLASTPDINSWAIYPIPDGYPVSYSSGISKIHFFAVAPRN